MILLNLCFKKIDYNMLFDIIIYVTQFSFRQ